MKTITMQKIEFTKEQKKDFSKSLIERIKNFFKEVFYSEKLLNGKELDEHLLFKTTSEEEKETLTEVFEEIDMFYQMRKELAESGKEIDVWYDEEIERIVKQIKPDASLDEINHVKAAVAMQIDVDIEFTSQALEELTTLIQEVMDKEVEA